MKPTPYPPGMHPGRREYTPDKFSPRQEHIYQALNIAVSAWTHERTANFHPTPGVDINMVDFINWQIKALSAWKQENTTRGKRSKPITIHDFPDAMWKWLYQRIRAAPPAIKPTSFYG